MTDLDITTHDAGVPPAPPEAHRGAWIDRSGLYEVLDCLLCIEELLSSGGEVAPVRLAALLHLVNDRLVAVVRGVGEP